MQTLRKIGPFLLLPLIFLSSVGFSIDVHFCKDSIKDIAFIEAADCDMEITKTDVPPCHKKCGNQISKTAESEEGICKMKCCHNERFNYEVPGEMDTAPEVSISHSSVQSVLIYFLCDFYSYESLEVNPVSWVYEPPIPKANFSILYQVFRI
jgi:hypothetical protein